MEKTASSALMTNIPGVQRQYMTTAPTRHTATVALVTPMKTPVFLWFTVVFLMTAVQRKVPVVGVLHQFTQIWPTTPGKPAVKLIGALPRQIPRILMPRPLAARPLLRGRTAYQ